MVLSKPYTDSGSYCDCTNQIIQVIQDRANELATQLRYEESIAETILGDALSYYVDERFSVTNSKLLNAIHLLLFVGGLLVRKSVAFKQRFMKSFIVERLDEKRSHTSS